jgi:AcrR family transcriptional regulator
VADADTPARRTQGVRPPERLTRERVVAAATRLIDQEGAAALTIRRLAAEVGVSKNAVSWHVGDRAELLALVGASWLGTIVPPAADGDPIDWLGEFAHAYRTAAHRHPHLARLAVDGLAAVTVTGDIGVPEAVISRLADTGMTPGELADAYNVVVAAVVGFVALELAGGVDAAVPADLARLEPSRAPSIVEHLATVEDHCFALAPTANRFDDSFRALVEAVLAALRQRRGRSGRGRG